MNRRSFLGAVLAAPLVAAGRRVDDSAALQRRIDAGEPIVGGQYWVRRPVDIRGRHVRIEGNTFHLLGALVLRMDASTTGTITNCVFLGT